MSETDAYIRGVAAGEATWFTEREKLRAENARLQRHSHSMINAMNAENERLRAVLPFFRSVILSGESWTDVCEQRYREAMGQ